MLHWLERRLRGMHEQLVARRAVTTGQRRAAAVPRGADVDRIVDFLMEEEAGGIEAWQIPEEFRALARIVELRRPKTVLEIGTADGGTLFAHARLAHEQALIVSIDLPHGPFGGGYPSWRIPLYQSFAGPEQRLELLRVDSHARSTVEQVERILEGRRIDYAFIDGDHTYDGVSQDFELCLRFAAADAVIAFHDIAERPNPEWRAVAASGEGVVHDFWSEVKREYGHEEFIHDPLQEGYGIGVLYLDQKIV